VVTGVTSTNGTGNFLKSRQGKPVSHFWGGLVVFRPPLWSSGQSYWSQIRRPGFDSRHYQGKKSSGSGTGSTQPREYN
jgi:hypothetical protein